MSSNQAIITPFSGGYVKKNLNWDHRSLTWASNECNKLGVISMLIWRNCSFKTCIHIIKQIGPPRLPEIWYFFHSHYCFDLLFCSLWHLWMHAVLPCTVLVAEGGPIQLLLTHKEEILGALVCRYFWVLLRSRYLAMVIFYN